VARGQNRESSWDDAGRDFRKWAENGGKIVAVAAAVLWQDGRVTTGWSNVDPSNLARMILVLDEKQRRVTIHDADLKP
jgi:hypothetical protein